MIYIQNGPAWRPKVIDILKYNFADGIIWDPRDETIEKVDAIKMENIKLNKIDNIVDNKWYYRQFENSELKKLLNLDYMPDSIIDRTFLRDSEKIHNTILKCFDYQKKYNPTKLLLPTVYLPSFSERIVDKVFDMCDFALKEKEQQLLDYDIYISLVIQENAFNNMSDINDFIDDMGMYVNKISGLYLIIDRDNSDNIRHNFDPKRLKNIMNFNYTLNNAKFKLIYGYCGLESLMFIASGASAIGTGWFYSLRKFNKQEKGLVVYNGQGRHIKRYTSIKILHEVKMEEILFQALPENKQKVFDLIVGETDFDCEIKNSVKIDNITINSTYLQYFECINEMLKPMEDLKIKDRIPYCENIILQALENIKEYNNLIPTPLTSITDVHIKNYQTALNDFKLEHYID